MALNIEFQGFVNEIKTFDWGTVAKMTHSRRQQNKETKEWETVGKDYLDVVLPQDVTVTENQLLEVAGTFKVETYEKRDGSTGIALKVRAALVQEVVRGRQATQAPEEMPF
jgi:hypothetical protein